MDVVGRTKAACWRIFTIFPASGGLFHLISCRISLFLVHQRSFSLRDKNQTPFRLHFYSLRLRNIQTRGFMFWRSNFHLNSNYNRSFYKLVLILLYGGVVIGHRGTPGLPWEVQVYASVQPPTVDYSVYFKTTFTIVDPFPTPTTPGTTATPQIGPQWPRPNPA